MNVLVFTLLVWLVSLGAGFLGSLTGLCSGVIFVPLLTLVFKVDIRYAIGASLVSVIATSSGAAALTSKRLKNVSWAVDDITTSASFVPSLNRHPR